MAHVTREITIPVSPATVWRHIIDPERRRRWFGGQLEFDELAPGSEGTFTAPGERRGVRVDDVEDGRSITYTWDDGDNPSQVHIEVESAGDGSRVRVTESTDAAVGEQPSAMSEQPQAMLAHAA